MTGNTCGGLPADVHPLAPVVSAAITTTTLVVAFGLLALDVEHFWVTFVVGFGGVLPVSLATLNHRQSGQGRTADSGAGSDRDDALETLQSRYARGELSDAEFEHRVERLLETNDATGTRTGVDDSGDDRGRGGDRGFSRLS